MELKKQLIDELSKHTETLHLVLEGEEKDFDIRLIYLGHLAMCARFFKILHLDQPVVELKNLFTHERRVYSMATPKTEDGANIKQSWNNLIPSFDQYFAAHAL